MTYVFQHTSAVSNIESTKLKKTRAATEYSYGRFDKKHMTIMRRLRMMKQP